MSIRFSVRNTTTNTQLAVRDIPDAALPVLQAHFGTAQEALDWIFSRLRHEVMEQRVAHARQTALPAVQTAEEAERTSFAVSWPE